MLLGAQYTFVIQNQSALTSPYQGPLSLHPDGDTQPTHTIGTTWAGRRSIGRSFTSIPRNSWVRASAGPRA